MKNIKIQLVLFFFLGLIIIPPVRGEEIILYSNSDETITIANQLELLEDTQNILSVKEVLRSRNFQKTTLEVPNLQISNSSFWAKFQIKNLTDQQKIVLELPYPIIDEVILYSILPSGEYKMEKAGEYIPVEKRFYKHQNYIFNIEIPTNETRTFLIKVRSSEQMQLPLIVGTSNLILESLLTKDLIFGIYAGIILVMFFYNLFVYFVVKDRTYLYYVSYILTVGLTQACLQGYSFRFLFLDSSLLANQSMIIIPALSGVTALIFLNSFLQVKIHTPTLYKIILIIYGMYALAISLGIVGQYHISQNLVQLCAMLGSVLVFIIAYKTARKGLRAAKFFFIAWSIFLSSVIIFVLKNFGILPYNNFTFYALQIGSGLEVILLSLALADRINIFKKEKEESQQQTVNALLENERIIKEQNIILEAKVTERTFELKKSNNELTTTLSELKQTQSQLVNAEKMASLGQLTAGIAHEINNPINFVVSNVKPLRRDIEDIYQLVNKYETIHSSDDIQNELLLVNTYKKEIDYDYLKEEISTLLKGIEEGAVRTADIVKGLRVFSRLDENDLKRTNVIDGLDSTISLLNSEINGYIDLEKNYAILPDIECYPGKLNQVFMNILNNAIFAIKENTSRVEKGLLVITTSSDSEFVKISIKDNGIGMSDKIKAKIFEPFFTTKDVGKGTGLGMSITFSIINDHNGKIEVNSEFGKGTEFILILPINQ